MARQSLKITIPVYWNKISAAAAVARGEKVGEPGEARTGTRHRWRSRLDAEFAQRFNLSDPCLGSKLGRYVAAARAACPVRLVECQHVGYVGAG